MSSYVVTLQNEATSDTENLNGEPLAMSGYSDITFVVNGDFNGLVAFEGTIDEDEPREWFPIAVENVDGEKVPFAEAPGVYLLGSYSLYGVRARVAAMYKGAVTVRARYHD